MTDAAMTEKLACVELLAAIASHRGDPPPQEFEAFLVALNRLRPLPTNVTAEGLLGQTYDLDAWLNQQLGQIQTPALQQQVYQGAYHIVRAQGLTAEEKAILAKLATAFQLSEADTTALAQADWELTSIAAGQHSALEGMAAMISREQRVRRVIFDYALGAAIIGLIPITIKGSLETKLIILILLILKMVWDIRKLWGAPTGQDLLAIIGRIFGGLGAVLAGMLAWATAIGLGVIIPYVGGFAKAAAFATATWIIGQTTSQFYTSQKRPNLTALKRAFPMLLDSSTLDSSTQFTNAESDQ